MRNSASPSPCNAHTCRGAFSHFHASRASPPQPNSFACSTHRVGATPSDTPPHSPSNPTLTSPHGKSQVPRPSRASKSTAERRNPIPRRGSQHPADGIDGTRCAAAQNHWEDADREKLLHRQAREPDALARTSPSADHSPCATAADEREDTPSLPTAGAANGIERMKQVIHEVMLSLYEDQIRSTVREVHRRLAQREPCLRTQRKMFQLFKHPSLSHLYEITNRGDIYLRNPPENFTSWIDPKNPEDPFPRHVWVSFLRYLMRLLQFPPLPSPCHTNQTGGSRSGGTAAHAPYQFYGGRYGMALELQNRLALYWDDEGDNEDDAAWVAEASGAIHRFLSDDGDDVRPPDTDGDGEEKQPPQLLVLPPLEGSGGVRRKRRRLSLGHWCHLVQLATFRGFLQYENNVLQPRAASVKIAAAFLAQDTSPLSAKDSLSILRHELADAEIPAAADGRSAMCGADDLIRDKQAIRQYLSEILQENPGGILLSQVKKEFSKRSPLRLSPTIFGFTRISSLLLSTDFQDLCRVFVDRKNHVIVQMVSFEQPSDSRLLGGQRDECEMEQTLSMVREASGDVVWSVPPIWDSAVYPHETSGGSHEEAVGFSDFAFDFGDTADARDPSASQGVSSGKEDTKFLDQYGDVVEYRPKNQISDDGEFITPWKGNRPFSTWECDSLYEDNCLRTPSTAPSDSSSSSLSSAPVSPRRCSGPVAACS